MKLSVLSLIVANVIPIFGVLFFEWKIFDIMFLYWLESGVIGFYFILKLLFIGKIFHLVTIPFFIIHFGLFMFVHLVFIFFIFNPSFDLKIQGSFIPSINTFVPFLKTVTIPISLLFLSHGISFLSNFIKNKEYTIINERHNGKLILTPYSRIFIMHITITFGGFLFILFRTPAISLIMLIVLKTFVDLYSHLREHRSKV